MYNVAGIESTLIVVYGIHDNGMYVCVMWWMSNIGTYAMAYFHQMRSDAKERPGLVHLQNFKNEKKKSGISKTFI